MMCVYVRTYVQYRIVIVCSVLAVTVYPSPSAVQVETSFPPSSQDIPKLLYSARYKFYIKLIMAGSALKRLMTEYKGNVLP